MKPEPKKPIVNVILKNGTTYRCTTPVDSVTIRVLEMHERAFEEWKRRTAR